MTDIEAKALALVNEVFIEKGGSPIDYAALVGAGDVVTLALCRAIEQHEAFKQEVSDVMTYIKALYPTLPRNFDRFITPKPKPDPLVEVMKELVLTARMTSSDLRAALEVRGLEIREKGQ
jgi:hypothetical protein